MVFILYKGIFTAYINKVIQTLLLILSEPELNKK